MKREEKTVVIALTLVVSSPTISFASLLHCKQMDSSTLTKLSLYELFSRPLPWTMPGIKLSGNPENFRNKEYLETTDSTIQYNLQRQLISGGEEPLF